MRSWTHYNRSLVKRGNFFLLIDPELIKNWQEPRDRPGRKRYSNQLILLLLTLRTSLRMTFRSIQGLSQGLVDWMKIDLTAPDYSCLCKRMGSLKDFLPKMSHRRPCVLLIDSSGLKSFGCNEWLRYRHQVKAKSRWIKVHLGVDAKSQEVISFNITDSSGSDARQLPIILEAAPRSIKEVIADGAYDTQSCREAISNRQAKPLIAPRKGSLIGAKKYPGSQERDDACRVISALGNDEEAVSLWKKLTGYGRRSLVETTFSRLKRRFGTRVQSQTIERQEVEVGLKLRLLNQELRLKAS